MTCFIHTADWQIGKPYLQVKNEQKRFKLQQERLHVIGRISDVAKVQGSSFVLVAGDLFDSPTPCTTVVLEALEAIGRIGIPVLAIPGNHDHGALGTIWHRDDFQRHQKELAPNFQLLLKRQPFEVDQAVILPCPLLRNKDNCDPTLWLSNFDWNTLSPKKPRIVLAHGGIYGFSGKDYALIEGNQTRENNLIQLCNLPPNQIDYIALGDWHNLKQINSKAWYSGTPEPDRFDQGEDNHRGQILKVDISRGEAPKVKVLPTGGIQWHSMSFRFNSDRDVDHFERQIEELTAGRISRDLLRVEISGSLSLDGHHRYEELKVELENKLLRLRIKGTCQKAPQSDELEQLTSQQENPLISQVAIKLQKSLASEEDQDSEKASLTRMALCELFRFTVKS